MEKSSTKLIALSGPSGIGKDYIKCGILKKYPNLKELVWYTTRPSRGNETSRACITEAEFQAMAANDELALIQQIYGNFYAVRKDSLFPSEDSITEFHPHIIAQAKEINPNIITIGIITDDISLLRNRLALRSTETSEEIEHRVSQAQSEIDFIKQNSNFYNFVLSISKKTDTRKRILDFLESYMEV